jgi:hypothetical protein
MLLRAPIIPSSVLSTTNLLLWLASNFPDGLMVADLGIESHKSCVHFVDSSRIGLCGLEGAYPEYAFQASGPSRIGSNAIGEVSMSRCWRLQVYLSGPTAGGFALADDFSISARPFLASSMSSG